MRDFFAYIMNFAGGWVIMPGTNDKIALGDDWFAKAQTGHNNALRACDYERDNENILAGLTWQNLFGTMISMDLS